MRKPLFVVGALVAVVTLGFQQFALAGGGDPVDLQDLHGKGPSVWDPQNQDDGCIGPSTQYVPVHDGSYGGNPDAFDGALAMTLDSKTFSDVDGMGTRSGQQFKVGPSPVYGWDVTRTDRALSTSPTERDLIRLKNYTDGAISKTLEIDTELGSDSLTVVNASSSGDTSYGLSDRWVISTDGAPFSDPPVTHVLFGKGAREKPVDIVNSPDGSPGIAGCLTVDFHITIPAGATRYMLFFLQMHDPAQTSLAAALNDASKFNRRGLNPKLLDGISNKVMKNILNWDLT